jgi:PAS domain-containing protein
LSLMFIKSIVKINKATGERKEQFRLCESYRADNAVRHRTILHLGPLEQLPDTEQKKALGKRIEQLIQSERAGDGLFSVTPVDDISERLARQYYAAIKEKQRIDIAAGKDYHLVDVNSVKNKQIREVGAEWLCLQAIEQLKIGSFLEEKNWSEDAVKLALTHIASRAVYPASELRTSQWIRENSAVCELTGYPQDKITKDRLYAISHSLYEVKGELEQHLSSHTNEIFDLEDKIILYDLTNTYYEGQMRSSKIARFGRSKEKRSDARLVVLAVVVNVEGFLKYSNIYEGSKTDSKTLGDMLEQMNANTSATGRKPVVVLDAGIATEDNIALLNKDGYRYMCVSRSKMKKYTADTGSKPIVVTDRKQQPITLQKVKVAGCADNYLHVHSGAKEHKEASMNNRFAERFEDGLKQIKESLGKKSGIKKQDKVWERIGRLKAKYPSIHKHYEINTKSNKDIITDITWSRKTADKKEGQYLLRTNLDEKDEHTQWTIYNTIREIEYTFRVLKTDLDLRPVYHKTDKASMAHLHLGLLAYWVVNTIRYQLKQKGINNEWRDVVRIMNTQKVVTTTMKNDRYQQISIRQCSEPTEQVQVIYNALNYKIMPFTRKKSVVPLPEFKKPQPVDNMDIPSG